MSRFLKQRETKKKLLQHEKWRLASRDHESIKSVAASFLPWLYVTSARRAARTGWNGRTQGRKVIGDSISLHRCSRSFNRRTYRLRSFASRTPGANYSPPCSRGVDPIARPSLDRRRRFDSIILTKVNRDRTLKITRSTPQTQTITLKSIHYRPLILFVAKDLTLFVSTPFATDSYVCVC